jgi:hypothetical protein
LNALSSQNPTLETQVPNLQDLLARGYFPKELPPPFTTVSFASHVCTAPRVADFAKTIDQKPKSSKAGRYSLARGGLLRRPLSICNPVAYFLLCQEIVSSWTEISPFVVGTVISSTHPEEKATGRAVDGHFPQSARSEQARQKRLGSDTYYKLMSVAITPASIRIQSLGLCTRKQQRKSIDLLVLLETASTRLCDSVRISKQLGFRLAQTLRL